MQGEDEHRVHPAGEAVRALRWRAGSGKKQAALGHADLLPSRSYDQLHAKR